MYGQPDSFKYQWARFVARKQLENDRKVLKTKLTKAYPGVPIGETIGELVQFFLQQDLDELNSTPKVSKKHIEKLITPPPEKGKFKVGIIGAGCAGLFTALILDWLHEVVPELEISYDILEASGKERLGGRLYTHKFSEKTHDYYDVGAMRFPNNDIMNRRVRFCDSDATMLIE